VTLHHSKFHFNGTVVSLDCAGPTGKIPKRTELLFRPSKESNNM